MNWIKIEIDTCIFFKKVNTFFAMPASFKQQNKTQFPQNAVLLFFFFFFNVNKLHIHFTYKKTHHTGMS